MEDRKPFALADLSFRLPEAVESLVRYATGPTRNTIQVYDLGEPEGATSPPDRVTLADVGRVAIINADLRAPDIYPLLHTNLSDARIDPMWDLANADPAEANDPDSQYSRMLLAWKLIDGIHGIGRTKASKLLHLKAPHAFPLLDSYVVAEYRSAALRASREYRPGSTRPELMYWAAVRADLLRLRSAKVLADIRSGLEDHGSTGHLVSGLSDLRLIDILVWERTVTRP